jgi:hypothetical protein
MCTVGIILEHIFLKEKLIIHTSQTDVDKANSFWNKSDKTLEKLYKSNHINKTKWCDLSLKDYEFFIVSAVEKFFKLPSNLKSSTCREIMDLKFLIQSLAKYYSEKLDLNLESIKIYIHNEYDISFDFKLNTLIKL